MASYTVGSEEMVRANDSGGCFVFVVAFSPLAGSYVR